MLNRAISTPIAIIIILVLVILVGGFTWLQYGEMWKEAGELPEMEIPEKSIEAEGEDESVSNEYFEIRKPKRISGVYEFSSKELGISFSYLSYWGKDFQRIERTWALESGGPYVIYSLSDNLSIYAARGDEAPAGIGGYAPIFFGDISTFLKDPPDSVIITEESFYSPAIEYWRIEDITPGLGASPIGYTLTLEYLVPLKTTYKNLKMVTDVSFLLPLSTEEAKKIDRAEVREMANNLLGELEEVTEFDLKGFHPQLDYKISDYRDIIVGLEYIE